MVNEFEKASPADAVNPRTAGAPELVVRAREAQREWARASLRGRLVIVRRLRKLIADESALLIEAVGAGRWRSAAEILTNEVIPLADACQFLEREATRLLRARRLGWRGRPAWLTGVRAEVRREPLGEILILAPGNYPLFLPGVQILQAVVAGNAVLLKPAPGRALPMIELHKLLAMAGLPRDVLQVLGEDVRMAKAIIAAGVDKVVLTGSMHTGKQVLTQLAPRLTPAALELSGNDAVYILPGADLEMVAAALAFGLKLNGGQTCIAPRRVFVPIDQMPTLERHLLPLVTQLPAVPVSPPTLARSAHMLAEARNHGARLSVPEPHATGEMMSPVIVMDASPELQACKEAVFAPILSLIPVANPMDALRLDAQCPYALGAAIFGPQSAALKLASEVRAGSVTINDLILPTADPRLPFGGRDASGYGVTRGAHGLLELTRIKTVSTRAGRFRPHYEQERTDDAALFTAYLKAAHAGSWRERSRSLLRVLNALLKRERQGKRRAPG
jgi:acyl-CoA reductase-like NAD-dependent aldehyde dehydrogenase